jgi:hypothetical protein
MAEGNEHHDTTHGRGRKRICSQMIPRLPDLAPRATYSTIAGAVLITVMFKTVGASPILPYAATFPQEKWISTNTQFLREIELGLDRVVSYLYTKALSDSFQLLAKI